MNYSTMKAKGFTSRVEAWGLAVLFTVILVVAQGMEVKGQSVENVLTIEQFGESGRQADYEGFNNLFGNETAKFTIAEGLLRTLNYGSSEMLVLQDGESIGAVSASSRSLENVVLMVVWIPTEDCVQDLIGHYPNNLAQLLPNLKYVYVQGGLTAKEAEAIQVKRGASGNLLIVCDKIATSNAVVATATEQ